MKLVVAICSARDWKPQFGSALAGLIAHCCIHLQKEIELFDLRVYSNCSNICNGRQFAIDEAIERGFTHLLFLDDDMTFPANVVEILKKHDADIVGVNYSQKTKEGKPTALGMSGKYVQATAGALPVRRMGFGILLVRLAIVKKIPKPHFEMVWCPEHPVLGPHLIGEDYYFTDKVAKAGGKFICDLNIKVGHVGDYEYMLNDPLFAPVRKNAALQEASGRSETAA